MFLRNLEYFQGVLFLTTNRRQDFDDAFRSRIHVTISYPQLSNRSQSLIWKRLLTVNKNLRLSEGWTEGVYDALGKLNLNVRVQVNADPKTPLPPLPCRRAPTHSLHVQIPNRALIILRANYICCRDVRSRTCSVPLLPTPMPMPPRIPAMIQ